MPECNLGELFDHRQTGYSYLGKDHHNDNRHNWFLVEVGIINQRHAKILSFYSKPTTIITDTPGCGVYGETLLEKSLPPFQDIDLKGTSTLIHKINQEISQ